jgi:nicotinamide riboside kinase
MYGLSGASRSGKTTLAKRLSVHLEIPYVDSSTTALMQEAGFDPVSVMDIETRIKAQEHLLDAYLRLLDRQLPYFITDRTPVDMLAYTLGEVTMHNTTEALGRRIADYCDRCIAETEARFALVMLTFPLKSYDAQPGKPPASAAYQSMIHAIVTGALRNSQIPVMHVEDEPIEQRVEKVMQTIINWRRDLTEKLGQEVFH